MSCSEKLYFTVYSLLQWETRAPLCSSTLSLLNEVNNLGKTSRCAPWGVRPASGYQLRLSPQHSLWRALAECQSISTGLEVFFFFFGHSGFLPHQNRLSAWWTTLAKLDVYVDCVSFQSAGIDLGLEATARLLTLLDPWNHGCINYT